MMLRWFCPRRRRFEQPSGRNTFRLAGELLEHRDLLSVALSPGSDVMGSAQALSTPAIMGPQRAIADDYGDTFPTAAQVTLVASVPLTKYGSIQRPGDADMFRFVSPVYGWVTVEQKALPGSRLEPRLYVYSADRDLLADVDNTGSALNSRLRIRVVSGATYYLKVTGNHDTIGNYSLSFLATRDDYGDSLGTATALTLARDASAAQNGSIETAGDVDVFCYTSPVSGRVRITLAARPGSVLDPYLRVYDRAGRELARDDNSAGGLNSKVQFAVTAGGTYYVEASAARSTRGTYILSVAAQEILSGAGQGDVPTPLFYRHDLGFSSGRLHEPSADSNGTLWFSPQDGRLIGYRPSTGKVEVISLDRLTGRQWSGLHLWPVAAGRELYLCSPSLDVLLVYHTSTRQLSRYAIPYRHPQIFGGFTVGRFVYFYDIGTPAVFKWDTILHRGRLIPCPYRLSGTLYMAFADPARREIWGSTYVANDLVRFDMSRDEWSGHWKVPLDGAGATPANAVLDGVLYLSDHLHGRLIPFRVNEQRWEQPIPIPGYGQDFGYVGGGVYYRGLLYLCHSTWTGANGSIDGQPHHFTGWWSVFDPATSKFSRLNIPAKPGELLCSAYGLVVGNELYLTAVNRNAPKNALIFRTSLWSWS